MGLCVEWSEKCGCSKQNERYNAIMKLFVNEVRMKQIKSIFTNEHLALVR